MPSAIVEHQLPCSTNNEVSKPRVSRKRPREAAKRISVLAPGPLLEQWMMDQGVKPIHANFVSTTLHRDGVAIEEVLEGIPSLARDVLLNGCDLRELEAVEDQISGDGTRKWLFRLPHDGLQVETVFIPEADGRGVLCVSSSVGCALSCTFCHTGTQKLRRNLSADEILGQLLAARRALGRFPGPNPSTPAGGTKGAKLPGGADKTLEGITNVVFMGQGEPLLNWKAVKAAALAMTSDTGGAIAPRKVTISTSGVVPVIPRIAREVGCSLALSLHATTDKVRSSIVPLNRTWSIDAVLEAVRQYTLESSPQPVPARLQRLREFQKAGRAELPTLHGRPVGRRLVMFEYVMLKGVNDSDEDAVRLAALVKPFKCHVNLIPFNPWPGSGLACTEHQEVQEFGAEVLRRGVSCTIRWPKGRDIMAACGQLHSELHAAGEMLRH